MDELGLVAFKRSEIHIRTLAKDFTPCRGVVNFELESLTTGERFDVENALVAAELVDDECVLQSWINYTISYQLQIQLQLHLKDF